MAESVVAGEDQLSLKHQEIGGPACQQQSSQQNRVTEQHKSQEFLQHLQEMDGEGLLHDSGLAGWW